MKKTALYLYGCCFFCNFATVFKDKIYIAMNISYKWLKEYVDFSLTPQEVCDALTSEGLVVDAFEEL